MRIIGTALAIALAVGVTACSKPPSEDIAAAKASVDKAADAGASQYAADSMKSAETARAALDQELAAQDAKTFKSYDRAKQLAAEAKAAGDKATADAEAAKEKANAAAAAKARVAANRAAVKAKAVKVGGVIRPPVKVKNVAPVYPAIAKTAHVSGVVVLEATVGADGKVAIPRS